jgi:hypothetical protein
MRLVFAILPLFIFAVSVPTQVRSERTNVIVGVHPGGSEQRDFGEGTVRNFVGILVDGIRSDASDGWVSDNAGDPAFDFLSKIAVGYDGSAEPGNLQDLFDANGTSLMLMAGTYSERNDVALSSIFLGAPFEDFDLSHTSARFLTYDDFESGSLYLRIVVAYAVLREAERLDLDPRAITNQLAQNINSWIKELDRQDGAIRRRFPDLGKISRHVHPYLP